MLRLLATVLVAASFSGCSRSADDLIPVTGTVKFADGSVPHGESAKVEFEPIASGRIATGSIEPDGSFVMMTQFPGDGVEPGAYKVMLRIWKNYRQRTSAVPERYTDFATTPLEATVDADHTHFDFVVKP